MKKATMAAVEKVEVQGVGRIKVVEGVEEMEAVEGGYWQ